MYILFTFVQVLGKYLNEIDDLENRFQLATEVHVFDVGIDCLKQLRDRERMSSYINQIPYKRHPHFRPKIEALLNNSVSCIVRSYCELLTTYSYRLSYLQQIRWK